MTTKEKIAVMQAFEDRKTIQYKEKDSSKWYEWLHRNKEPNWNWDLYDYCIKPEPKVRPYTFEEMREAIKKHGLLVETKEGCWTIICFDKDIVSFYLENNETYAEFMKNNVWFDDNSPCGVVEE